MDRFTSNKKFNLKKCCENTWVYLTSSKDYLEQFDKLRTLVKDLLSQKMKLCETRLGKTTEINIYTVVLYQGKDVIT